MKKVYLLGAALIVGTMSMAQRVEEHYTFGILGEKTFDGPYVHNDLPTTNSDRALNYVWNEYFDGGTGLTTPNGTWSTAGTEGSYWTLSNSTTAPNGYAMSMTNDYLMWNSYDNVSEGSFASTPVFGTVESPNIDLSSIASAEAGIEFKINAMFCCNDEPWTIAISNDGGSTWGAEIPLDLGLGANDNSNDLDEPVDMVFIISSYLDAVPANNNDVRVRFTWDGTVANTAPQYSTHYYWGIDDVRIFELPQNEIANEEMWLADTYNEYEYTSAPANQLTTLTVQNKITNFGLNAPSALDMEVTVFDGGMSIVDGPVTGGTVFNAPVNSNETDTITFATAIDLSTYAAGDYMVRSVIRHDGGSTADESPENDTLWRSFKIDPLEMGHINYDAAVVNNIASYTVDVRFGGSYSFTADADLQGFNVELNSSGGTSATTTTGITMLLYVDDRTNDSQVGVYEYFLDNSMLDAPFTFNLHQADAIYTGSAPLTLTSGVVYTVSLEVIEGTVLWYNANLGDSDFSGNLYANSQWYWTGDEPHFTLNFDESLTIGSPIEDNNFTVGQNYPNPFDNNAVISYTLDEASDVVVTFTDLSGKVINTINQGSQAAGSYQIDVTSEDFASGVYFYTFNIGDKKVTKKMTVK